MEKKLKIQARIRRAEREVTYAFLHNRKKLKLHTRTGKQEFLKKIMDKFELTDTSVEQYCYLKWLCVLRRKEWPITLAMKEL